LPDQVAFGTCHGDGVSVVVYFGLTYKCCFAVPSHSIVPCCPDVAVRAIIEDMDTASEQVGQKEMGLHSGLDVVEERWRNLRPSAVPVVAQKVAIPA
jgi:hypothetical protein